MPAFTGTLLRRVRQVCDPVAVLLFGSWAKGTATVHSDVDLVALLDGRPSPALRAELLDAVGGVPMRVDLLLWTPAELELARHDPHGFHAAVLSSAVVLHRRKSDTELAGLRTTA